MENKLHRYKTSIEWTGNNGTGTSSYKSYDRSHLLKVESKPVIECSSDVAFNGDATKFNPEELLLASVSSCHMLWYLHLCAENKIIIIAYTDEATGIMKEDQDGSGKFISINLSPSIILSEESMEDTAMALHRLANKKCFIANSLNFKVTHSPIFKTKIS